MNVLKTIKDTVNYWWIYLIMGLLFVIGAAYVMMTPAASYLTLSILFATIMLVDGLGGVIFSLSNRDQIDGWGWQLASGIVGTLIGLALFMHPDITMTVLPIYIGFWILMKGSTMIGLSFDIKSYGEKNWGWVFVFGILNAILGVMMIVNPLFGSSIVLLFTSIAMFTIGIVMIAAALKLRKVKKGVGEVKEAIKEGLEELRS
jgi:uncharacterized membrane protein HdeD (DUF308 family)